MTKHLVPHSDSSHKHVLTRHTENEDFQVKRVIQTSSPKGGTLQSRESQRIMNFSLHLQTIFTLRRQNKATSKEKKQPIHIYKNCTRHVLVRYFNSMTGSVLAERCTGNSPCTYTYIHIPRAMNLSDVANTCSLPFHTVRIFLLWVASGPCAPTVQPPHSLAAASLASGVSLWDATVGGGKALRAESGLSGVPLL